MKLENRFTVPVPRDEAWRVLLDVERIVPCMPGATLLSREGDTFTGQVRVKVGPINLTYGGKASFVSLDEAAGIAVIEGSGKETRGTGTAKATITCRLVEQGDSTDVEVDTDLAVTGKPASFGRGILADVSAKLVDQFAACLAEEIREGGGARPADPATVAAEAASALAAVSAPESAPQTGPQTAPSAVPAAARPPRTAAAPIDLVDTAGLPVLKRALSVLAGLAALALLLRRLRR
jgi:carbon monoxide dehydrogenase subunit G